MIVLAVGFRGSAFVANSTTSVNTVVPMPAGLVAGDRVYVIVGSLANGATITSPSGWTKVAELDSSGSTLKSALYYRNVTGGEAASYTWVWSASNRTVGIAVAYFGIDLTAAMLGTSVTPATFPTSLQTDAFATGQDGDWALIAALGQESPGTGTAKTWTVNDGADAKRVDVSTSAVANITAAWWDTNRNLASGSVVQRTVTPSVFLTPIHAWAYRLATAVPVAPEPTGPNPWTYAGMPQVATAAPPASGGTTTYTYTASTAQLPNQERGFFQYSETHYQLDGSGYSPLSSSTLASARTSQSRPLVFRYFVMEKFLNQDVIDPAWLALVASDLAAIRTAGCKGILRFVYSTAGNMDAPPYGADPPAYRVLSHIAQIAPTVNAAADVVEALQTGFIGMWGEWYYTDNFGDKGTVTTVQYNDRLRVVAALLDNLDPRIFVLVRYPGLKARWFA